jgi:hypothetical protein
LTSLIVFLPLDEAAELFSATGGPFYEPRMSRL